MNTLREKLSKLYGIKRNLGFSLGNDWYKSRRAATPY